MGVAADVPETVPVDEELDAELAELERGLTTSPPHAANAADEVITSKRLVARLRTDRHACAVPEGSFDWRRFDISACTVLGSSSVYCDACMIEGPFLIRKVSQIDYIAHGARV